MRVAYPSHAETISLYLIHPHEVEQSNAGALPVFLSVSRDMGQLPRETGSLPIKACTDSCRDWE